MNDDSSRLPLTWAVFKAVFQSREVDTGLRDFKTHGCLQCDVSFVTLSFTRELGKGSWHTAAGWGWRAGVGKAVPVSVTTLGISSSGSVAEGFSSHSLYLNTEV